MKKFLSWIKYWLIEIGETLVWMERGDFDGKGLNFDRATNRLRVVRIEFKDFKKLINYIQSSGFIISRLFLGDGIFVISPIYEYEYNIENKSIDFKRISKLKKRYHAVSIDISDKNMELLYKVVFNYQYSVVHSYKKENIKFADELENYINKIKKPRSFISFKPLLYIGIIPSVLIGYFFNLFISDVSIGVFVLISFGISTFITFLFGDRDVSYLLIDEYKFRKVIIKYLQIDFKRHLIKIILFLISTIISYLITKIFDIYWNKFFAN